MYFIINILKACVYALGIIVVSMEAHTLLCCQSSLIKVSSVKTMLFHQSSWIKQMVQVTRKENQVGRLLQAQEGVR